MSGKSIRIGQILIKQGVLSEQQVLEILQVQKKQRLPFGVIAEPAIPVHIRFDARWASWVEERTWHASQTLEHTESEGLVSFAIPQLIVYGMSVIHFAPA